MIDTAHQELLAQVASLYYGDELTQSAIAEQLGLSRVKIYRLLKQAREEQVIQFTINWPLARDQELERALCVQFALQEALVLRSRGGDPQHGLHRLGAVAARYLEQILHDGMTLTVCLGRSTYEAINAIRPGFQAKVQVVQAMGSMVFAQQSLDSATLARLLAQKLGGQVTYLAAPGMADSAEAAAVLRSQRDIERVLTLARSAQVALLGIGNLDPTTSNFVKAGLIAANELTAIGAAGAVGDMGGQFITAAGARFDHPWNERVIGLQLDEIKQITLTIAVAGGAANAAAICCALRTGAVDVLCTDAEAARAVVALAQ
jgi:DNA-binding transcriptional regulator LsrR (DeoR family)